MHAKFEDTLQQEKQIIWAQDTDWMRRQKLPKVLQKYLKTAWVDEVYEMTAAEVKGRDPKITWEIVGIYRAPNKGIRLFEKLADQKNYKA